MQNTHHGLHRGLLPAWPGRRFGYLANRLSPARRHGKTPSMERLPPVERPGFICAKVQHSPQTSISMKLDTLRNLYIHELQDLHSAEIQIMEVLPLLAKSSTDSALRSAFEAHL